MRGISTMKEFDVNQSAIKRYRMNAILRYALLILVAFIMLYPILWLLGASFKTNAEIFGSIGFVPESWDFSGYTNGWKTSTEYTFATYLLNSFKIAVPRVIFTIVSCTLVAYGFARFNFPFKNMLFGFVIATLFLPAVVTRIPLYLFWRDLNLLDTYIPLIANTVFAQEAFFIFMLVQFLRGIPREFDEAATIDGCNSLQVFTKIIVPLLKPALITVALFQFIWTVNNFMEPLIYLSSVSKFPVSLALNLSLDVSLGVTPWNQVIAMSLMGILPSVIIFFIGQKYFVDGVSAGGIKG